MDRFGNGDGQARRFRIEPRRGEGGLKPAPTQANRLVHLLLEWDGRWLGERVRMAL
jgi:hypothetical protein